MVQTQGAAGCRKLIISCLFYPRKQLYPDPITDVREVSTETLSKAALTTVMWTFEAFGELALWTGLGGERTFAAVRNLKPIDQDRTSIEFKWWRQPMVSPLLL